MEDILKDIKVIQEKKVTKGVFKGQCYVYTRINPYNPLSYITIAIAIVVSILLYGAIETLNELKRNPFKWK